MSDSERLYHPQVILPVRARVVVVPGETRFVFRSPGIGDDWNSNRFFETYDGREGLIVSYETQHQQYPPGVYLWRSFGSHGFYVLFDGETTLRFVKSNFAELISGFKLLEEAPDALAPDAKIAPLPEEVMFVRGDIVHYADDLLQTPRLITEVSIDKSGIVWYGVGYSEEEQRAQKKQEELDRRESEAGGPWYTSFSMPTRNRKRCYDIVLIEHGHSAAADEEQPGMHIPDYWATCLI